jgi:hypothetical protein
MKALHSCAVAIGALSLFVGDAEAQVTYGPGTPTAQSAAETYFWSQSANGDLPLRPRDTHVCFLTGFRGDFADGGLLVVHRSTVDVMQGIIEEAQTGQAVLRNDIADTWKLGGFQNEGEAAGNAACVPFSAFITDEGGFAQVSERAAAQAQTPLVGIECDTRSAAGSLWDGQSTTWLTGFRGAFESFNESISIEEPRQVSDRAKVVATVEACAEGMLAIAYSLFVGTENMGRYPNTVGAGKVTVGANQSFEQPLARTQDAICYLKRISGSVQGNGEGAAIEPTMINGEEWWVLRGGAGGDGQLEVATGCLRYDQRTDAPPILDNIP